jgi:hypothetical protein
MKLSDIEDAEKLVTKEYLDTVLDAKLSKLGSGGSMPW